MMITGAHRAELHTADGTVLVVWVCHRCGGHYRSEKQASQAVDVNQSHSTENGHSCRARPK